MCYGYHHFFINSIYRLYIQKLNCEMTQVIQKYVTHFWMVYNLLVSTR